MLPGALTCCHAWVCPPSKAVMSWSYLMLWFIVISFRAYCKTGFCMYGSKQLSKERRKVKRQALSSPELAVL